MQVSRTTLKIGLGAPQSPCASFGFDELDGPLLGHRFPTILAMRAGQRRREFEPDDIPVHYGGRIHGVKLSEAARRNKRRISSVVRLISVPTDQPLYRFTLFSRHPLGEKFWNEILKIDETGQRELKF